MKQLNKAHRYARPLPFSAPLPGDSITSLPETKDTLRVIPFGGVEEVGINMTAYEYGNDIIVIDMGLGFPPSSIHGVNYIIPNYQWLEENKSRIRALLVTHAHLDHIGAIAYILPRLGYPPVYSMPLSIGFIKYRLSEFNLTDHAQLNSVSPNDTLRFGNFTVQLFRVNHNIPDSVGMAITSPAGTVIHTGDWKLDFTPGDQKPAELHKLAKWGGEGVLALLSDSTNAKKPGNCQSEQELGATIDKIFDQTPGRMIFSSNALILTRIQQVMDAAARTHRKVAVVGRSMQNNVEIALSLGYLKVKQQTMTSIRDAKRLPDNQVVILTTGAQGEGNAGLMRMSLDEHREVQLKKTDTVVISANAIPGNENAMAEMVSNLTKLGVKVVFNQTLDIHASGHAQQEELKLMISLVKPKFFIPIHGELHMLTAHVKLAQEIGIPKENTFVPQNGTVFEFKTDQTARMLPKHLEASYVYVDGTAVGYVDPALFCDQETMATAGAVAVTVTLDQTSKRIVGYPDIATRGFIFIKGNEGLMREMKQETKKIADMYTGSRFQSLALIETQLQKELSTYLLRKTGRKPIVVTVVQEVTLVPTSNT